MTDIVERLRRDATCTSHHEAADEIERLRQERDRLIRLAHIAIENAYRQGHAEAGGHSEIAAESMPFVKQFKKAASAAAAKEDRT